MHRELGGASDTLNYHSRWHNEEGESPSVEFDSVDDYTTQQPHTQAL